MSKQGKAGTLQQDILEMVSRENGVRVVDIAINFKVTPNCVLYHLKELTSKGKVYSRQPKSGWAHRWYAASNDDRLWAGRKTDENRLMRYY